MDNRIGGGFFGIGQQEKRIAVLYLAVQALGRDHEPEAYVGFARMFENYVYGKDEPNKPA